jgi:CheY-like chemotaxis protein
VAGADAAARRTPSVAPIPVLLVDDNPSFLRAARQALEQARPAFAVHVAASGSSALDFLERRPPYAAAPRPAFVVLDFRLPDFNAPAVLARMIGNERLRRIPVLVLSQAAWAEDEASARAAGARAYHVKPSRIRSLRELVVAFWERHADDGEDSPC